MNQSFKTQVNRIKGLTKQEYRVLRELCSISKNLYNVGLYNIRQHYFEESYTSKASFFDNDVLPVWKAEKEAVQFSGKRVCRGLYRTATGVLVNADINGALNILRKSNLIATNSLQGIGCLAHPQRVRIV